jgi:NAD(P)-dependent dehydrogenase (short-subunit alcohol dehydrogenase family)
MSVSKTDRRSSNLCGVAKQRKFMKIAITGHTAGIGLALAELYQSLGHEVVGFSRTTGYNIAVASDRARIVADAQDCDMFFNNAHDWFGDNFAEVTLFEALWQSWRGQRRTIVNISSLLVAEQRQPRSGLLYRSGKVALEDLSSFCQAEMAWPQICVIRCPLVLTRFTCEANKVKPNIMSATKFAQIVHHAVFETEARQLFVDVRNVPID